MQPAQDHVAAFGMLPDVVHRRDIRAAPTIGAREQTNWNLVGCWIGTSAGSAPFKMPIWRYPSKMPDRNPSTRPPS
jgi:hypothetical protein